MRKKYVNEEGKEIIMTEDEFIRMPFNSRYNFVGNVEEQKRPARKKYEAEKEINEQGDE
jgi:hypothetical protein